MMDLSHDKLKLSPDNAFNFSRKSERIVGKKFRRGKKDTNNAKKEVDAGRCQPREIDFETLEIINKMWQI